LWAAPGADFLCIEPWCGIADSVDADQQLVNKEGILRLGKGQLFEVSWKARFY
jgi:galactose mutarotase-like enzyme